MYYLWKLHYTEMLDLIIRYCKWGTLNEANYLEYLHLKFIQSHLHSQNIEGLLIKNLYISYV